MSSHSSPTASNTNQGTVDVRTALHHPSCTHISHHERGRKVNFSPKVYKCQSVNDTHSHTRNPRQTRYPRVLKIETTECEESPQASSPFPSPCTKITGVLHELKDDIIISPCHPPKPRDVYASASSLVHPYSLRSGLENVYIQNSSGRFKLAPKGWAMAATLENTRPCQLEPVSSSYTGSPLDLAIFVQRMWSSLSSVCFGLLGGVGLLQLLIVNSIPFIWGRGDHNPFIVTYGLFAHVIPACFYVLVTLCLISLYDWCDFGHNDAQHWSDLISYKQTCIMVVIYVLVLIISLFNIKMDDFFILYRENKDFIKDEHEFSESVMIWKILDTIRCVLAILGWCVVATMHSEDMFLFHLTGMKKYDGHENLYVKTICSRNNQ